MSLFTRRSFSHGATSSLCILMTLIFSTEEAVADPLRPSNAKALQRTSAAPIIDFISPTPSATVTASSTRVELRLRGAGVDSKFKFLANGKDVSYLFDTSDCGWRKSCKISGRLSNGLELKPGWNNLTASVTTKAGALIRSRLRVYEKTTLVGDPTTGYAPSQAVHVFMSPSQGIEVDYNPDNNPPNAPYFYPGDQQGCSGGLTMIDLDRATFKYKATYCFGTNDNGSLQSTLGGLTEHDLLLASTPPGAALGQLNLSPIGGTDFTASNAPAAYSYQIIGYGQASAGVASESYNGDSNAAWHGLEGNLVNLGQIATSANEDNPQVMYGFQATGSAGFAIVPNGNSAAITVGNPKNLPIGNGVLTNVPPGFSNVTYSSPATNGGGAGVWMLVLDRYTLQLVSSKTYNASTDGTTENPNQMTDLLTDMSSFNNSAYLVFLTTLVGPNTSGNYGTTPLNTDQNQANQYRYVLSYVMQMGVSPYAFDKVMGNQWGLGYPSSAFSMVGIPKHFAPGGFPAAVPSGAACAVSATVTSACGANLDQWFSSALDTSQSETGALRGSLVRNRTFQYTPTDVNSFQPKSSDTPDTLLTNSISHAIANAPLVAWPMMDTTGRQQAYIYLSNKLNVQYFGGTNGTCSDTAQACGDIRSYYTGSNVSIIADKGGNAEQWCPATDQGNFTTGDCSDVAHQLDTESTDLGLIGNFQNVINLIHGAATGNIALQLSVAANDVVKQVEDATTDKQYSGQDPMSLSIDSLGVLSGISSAIGAFFPPAGVVSGILSATGGLLSIIKDAHKTNTDLNKDVRQLADLYTGSNTAAAQSATQFDDNLELATNAYLDSVYSDWFKLQAVSAMCRIQANTGWYYPDNVDNNPVAGALVAAARKNFYEQILGQHFGTTYIRTYGFAPRFPFYNAVGTGKFFPNTTALWQSLIKSNNLQNVVTDYSWSYRDTQPYYAADGKQYGDGVWDFNFITLQGQNITTPTPWTVSLGDALMGPPNSSDGTGNLNLNRDMLYDSGIFPTVKYSFWLPN